MRMVDNLVVKAIMVVTTRATFILTAILARPCHESASFRLRRLLKTNPKYLERFRSGFLANGNWYKMLNPALLLTYRDRGDVLQASLSDQYFKHDVKIDDCTKMFQESREVKLDHIFVPNSAAEEVKPTTPYLIANATNHSDGRIVSFTPQHLEESSIQDLVAQSKKFEQSGLIVKSLVTIIAVASLLGAPMTAFAWSYDEHVKISIKAFQRSCDSLKRLDTLGQKICDSEEIAICYGHMVALAGDHTRNFSQLVKPKMGLLKNSSLDCRSLIDSVYLSNATYESAVGIRATKQQPIGIIEYALLLPNNAEHFSPHAANAWERYFKKSISIKRDSFPTEALYVQQLFALSAFSAHFLQDSFSAGHNGVARQVQKHDYDNAYHDDVGDVGLLLQNSRLNTWRSYGDGYYEWNTTYFYANEYCSPSGRRALISFLNSLDDEKPEPIDEPVIDQACSSDKINTITVSYENVHLLDRALKLKQKTTCQLWDNCDNPEIVMAHPGELGIKGCKAFGKLSGVFTCDGNGELDAAMELHVRAVLSIFLIDSEVPNADYVSEIRSLIPNKYLAYDFEAFKPKPSIGSTKFISSSDWFDLNSPSKYPKHDFWSNTFFAYARTSKNPNLDRQAAGVSFLWKKKRLRFEGSFDWLSRSGKGNSVRMFDGMRVGVGSHLFELPLTNNIASLSIEAGIGVSDIWGTARERNAYYTYGGEIDFKLGKNVLFINLSKARNFLSDGDFRSNRVLIGYRVSSLDF